MEQQNEKQAYLDALVKELLEDTQWELPAEQRKCLEKSLAWNLVHL